MRPIVHTSRRKPEFPCRFRGTRTSASFSPGPGWRGESTGSLLTASAGSGRCRCTHPAAQGRGVRRCASDRVRKLCCSSLNKNSELWRAKRPETPPNFGKTQSDVLRRGQALRAGASGRRSRRYRALRQRSSADFPAPFRKGETHRVRPRGSAWERERCGRGTWWDSEIARDTNESCPSEHQAATRPRGIEQDLPRRKCRGDWSGEASASPRGNGRLTKGFPFPRGL